MGSASRVTKVHVPLSSEGDVHTETLWSKRKPPQVVQWFAQPPPLERKWPTSLYNSIA